MIIHRKYLQSLAFILLAALVYGCVPQPRPTYNPSLNDLGQLYLYLQPFEQEMHSLTFVVSNISVVSSEGDTFTVTDNLQVTGDDLKGMQMCLGMKTLPPDSYRGISVTLDRAFISGEDGEKELALPPQPIVLNHEFTVIRGKSSTLFLYLSHENLVTDGYRFTPDFVLAKPHQIPLNYLGLVSYPFDNNVKVINKRTLEIVRVISTGVGPKGVALDQKRRRAYVALAGDDAIELIRLDVMETAGRIKLHFGDGPTEIALTPDGRTLLTANHGSATVSIIDAASLVELTRIRLNMEPDWIVAGKAGRAAYALHSQSNSVSVIDLATRKLQAVITLDESPFRAALNRVGNRLYIICQYSSNLLVVDTQSLQVIQRIFVGTESTSVKVDPKNNLVYIGKKFGEIVVVDPSSLMFIDSFPLMLDAGFMTIDGEENALLVLSPAKKELHKINLVRKRDLAYLKMEDEGYALVVMGEF